MTKHELARKAVRHEPTDKLVVGFSFQNDETEHYFAREFGMSHEEFRKWAKDDLHTMTLMDELMMYISNPVKRQYALENGFAFKGDIPDALYDRFGIGWSSSQIGQHVLYSPLSIDDVPSFTPPDPCSENIFHFVDKEIDGYRSSGDGAYIVQYYTLFEKAYTLLGFEEFFIQCYENEALIEELLDKITDYKIKIAEQIVKYDVTFGHTGDDYGLQNGPMFKLDFWRKLFKPRLRKIWDVYKRNGIPVIHHSCGNCSQFLDDMIDIGLDVISPVQAMDAAALKKRYGRNLSFEGAIDCQTMIYEATPQQVSDNVKRLVDTMREGGGYILTAINIMHTTPLKNLEALINTMNEYR